MFTLYTPIVGYKRGARCALGVTKIEPKEFLGFVNVKSSELHGHFHNVHKVSGSQLQCRPIKATIG